MLAKEGKKKKRPFLGCKKRLKVLSIHEVTSEQHSARSGCKAVLQLGRIRTDCGLIGKIIKRRRRKENLDGQQGIFKAGKLKKEKLSNLSCRNGVCKVR